MSSKNVFRSPVGKKLITGITGLGLVVFALEHMIGNLAMFSGNDAYNEYAHFLSSLGPLLYVFEAGLVAFFLFHISNGIQIWYGSRKARPVGYDSYRSAGKPSQQSVSSRSMIVTGLILAVFLVIHLISFKFGPGGPGNADPSYVTSLGGEPARDLAKLVRHKFDSPFYAFGYSIVMLMLVVHLRHGIWSAFQSLGAMRPSLTPLVYGLGTILAIAIGLGFIALPLAIYFHII
jgi:succinate dehydrogenase / fumarate reductase, cytochrome b subunit